jgi:hypothetical protein
VAALEDRRMVYCVEKALEERAIQVIDCLQKVCEIGLRIKFDSSPVIKPRKRQMDLPIFCWNSTPFQTPGTDV